MIKLTPEDMKDYETYLKFGVHKAKILTFEYGTHENGSEYIDAFFEVDGVESEARLWFNADKLKGMRFNLVTLKGIYTHNAPESKKEAAKAAFEKCADLMSVVELLNAKLGGKEMWVSKFYDPSRTYEKEGQTYRSINTNIHGYEPEMKPELMPQEDAKPIPSGKQAITDDDVVAAFPEGKSVEEAIDSW